MTTLEQIATENDEIAQSVATLAELDPADVTRPLRALLQRLVDMPLSSDHAMEALINKLGTTTTSQAL